jgi:hypothetical protein
MTLECCAVGADFVCDDALLAPFTRRHLLALGATVAAGASLGGLVAAPPVVGRESWLRRASYTGRVGEPFRARLPGGATVTLWLVEVGDLIGTTPSGTSLAGRDDAFLLEFRGPDTPRLTQGVHELRHRAVGRGRLFVVPQAQRRDGNAYAVVVNRADRTAAASTAAL